MLKEVDVKERKGVEQLGTAIRHNTTDRDIFRDKLCNMVRFDNATRARILKSNKNLPLGF